MHDRVRDLVGLDELAHRLHGLGPFEPTVGRAFVATLGDVLGGRVHPARVEHVHPNPVAHEREGHVAGGGDERHLRRRVRQEIGSPAVTGDRTDQHDRTVDILPHHELGRLLGDETGGADVEGHHLVPHGGRGIPHRPAERGCCAVDRGMKRPEGLIGSSHAAFRTVRIGEIDRHEHGPAAVSRERRRGRFTLRLIAANEQQAARTLFFEQGCGGVAQALGASRDQGDTPVEAHGVTNLLADRTCPRRARLGPHAPIRTPTPQAHRPPTMSHLRSTNSGVSGGR